MRSNYTVRSLENGTVLSRTPLNQGNLTRDSEESVFPISYTGARQIVKKAGRKIGIEISPHDPRRHAATYSSRAGAPIEIVSKVILRHANLFTVSWQSQWRWFQPVGWQYFQLMNTEPGRFSVPWDWHCSLGLWEQYWKGIAEVLYISEFIHDEKVGPSCRNILYMLCRWTFRTMF